MRNLPTVTRNIIMINVIVFLATWLSQSVLHTDVMTRQLALFHPASPLFRIWQPVTYMFMHGGFWHIFFNMYTLMIFGSAIEQIIGEKKFSLLYLISGLGAAGLHLCVSTLTGGINIPTVGASGAIYGLLIAYAMLFPESRLTLLFPPVTLKARTMVLVFAGIELLTGITGTSEGIAHFAHLGGMLVGFLLIFFWKKRGTLFDRDNF